MDVPTLRRREKGVVVRLESHCSDHCPARFLRGLVPSGRRSALIAGMGRRGGGPGPQWGLQDVVPSPARCAIVCTRPGAPALELEREPLGDAEGWVRATCCWPVDTL